MPPTAVALGLAFCCFCPGFAGRKGWEPSLLPPLTAHQWNLATTYVLGICLTLHICPTSPPRTPIGFCTEEVNWADVCPDFLHTFLLECSTRNCKSLQDFS